MTCRSLVTSVVRTAEGPGQRPRTQDRRNPSEGAGALRSRARTGGPLVSPVPRLGFPHPSAAGEPGRLLP